MKKNFFMVSLVLVFALGSLSAQKVVFPTDSKGNIYFTNEYETNQSKAELFEAANLWAVSTFKSGDAVFSKDAEKGELMANGTVKSKAAYNPFAGYFQEFVTFIIKFNVTDGKITYTLYKPTLSETYAGYGTNTKTTNMDDLYIEYVKAYANKESAKNDPTLSKKDQKSIIKAADEFIKDKEESLMEAETALRDLIKMMESNLFR